MPATDWAARAEKAELADLERLWETLDIPDRRIEFLDGQIVVSPTASLWHSSAIDELIDALFDVKRAHGWSGARAAVPAHRPTGGPRHGDPVQ